MPAAQDVEAGGMAVGACRGLHDLAGLAIARKTSVPGQQGGPGTPTMVPRVWVEERPLAITGMFMNGTLATQRIVSEPSQSRGDLLRERYQALEELQRSKSLQRSLSRPTMLSAVRSFSYELPTQIAEMERMSNQRTSPPPTPEPHQTPTYLSKHSIGGLGSRSNTRRAGKDTGGRHQ